MTETRAMWRINRAVKEFGISRSTLYRWINAKHIGKEHRQGMSWVYPDEIAKHIEGERA